MTEIPKCLSHRPVDQRRNLPVPYVHDALDGRWDFTAILSERLEECLRQRLCGQCGKSLGWWLAFIGGPVSALTGVYNDPPMHEECARAALQLCPHINRANMKRATSGSLDLERFHSEHAILDRQSVWVLVITRGYTISFDGRIPLLHARAIKRRHGWRNHESGPGLVPLNGIELAGELKAARERIERMR